MYFGVFGGVLHPTPPPADSECQGSVTIPVVVKLVEKSLCPCDHCSSYRHDCCTPPFLAHTGTGPNTHAELELAPLLVRAFLYSDAFSLGGLFQPWIV